ncbi:MAG: cytochrome C oxidase subunit IV family protein [Planctomycetaceae bacterium]
MSEVSHDTGAQAHDHTHHYVNYFGIFLALCVCTGISVLLDVFKAEMLKSVLVFLVMAVAVAKALFVMTYFMHLKFEGAWKFIILAPTAILAVGLMIALAPDMAMHYYTNDAPQVKWVGAEHAEEVAETEHSEHSEHQHEHGGH